MAIFSPIFAVISITVSPTFLPESYEAGDSVNASTLFGFVDLISASTSSANFTKSVFFATKSVSQFSSTMTPEV